MAALTGSALTDTMRRQGVGHGYVSGGAGDRMASETGIKIDPGVIERFAEADRGHFMHAKL